MTSIYRSILGGVLALLVLAGSASAATPSYDAATGTVLSPATNADGYPVDWGTDYNVNKFVEHGDPGASLIGAQSGTATQEGTICATDGSCQPNAVQIISDPPTTVAVLPTCALGRCTWNADGVRDVGRSVHYRTFKMKMCALGVREWWFTCVADWHYEAHVKFGYNGHKAWRVAMECHYSEGGIGYDVSLQSCGWSGPNPAYYGAGSHLCSFAIVKISVISGHGPISWTERIHANMYGSGGHYVHHNSACWS